MKAPGSSRLIGGGVLHFITEHVSINFISELLDFSPACCVVFMLFHTVSICRVPYFPGLSRDFDCFDFILEWDGMSGMEVVFDSLIFLAVLIV